MQCHTNSHLWHLSSIKQTNSLMLQLKNGSVKPRLHKAYIFFAHFYIVCKRVVAYHSRAAPLLLQSKKWWQTPPPLPQDSSVTMMTLILNVLGVLCTSSSSPVCQSRSMQRAAYYTFRFFSVPLILSKIKVNGTFQPKHQDFCMMSCIQSFIH